ncbi:hypothetical protein [Marinobacter sp. SS21]|uniref:hypothetical protein n=1 Tax=Marinobacter sp. SS21 TaxID=2979460 RepID=UPI00232B752B|nr:hypothetical protein [Marinobacter sp. SS21]MDC0661081.1 hypothetical protein [Marinobacter sp. SS21]
MITLIALLMSGMAQARELVVVSGADSALVQLSREELQKLYFGQSSATAEGHSVVVYDLDSTEYRAEFYLTAFSMSLIQMRAYRAKQVFTGRGRPPRQLGVDDLIARLQQDGGAIGYLPVELAEGLTILHRF